MDRKPPTPAFIPPTSRQRRADHVPTSSYWSAIGRWADSGQVGQTSVGPTTNIVVGPTDTSSSAHRRADDLMLTGLDWYVYYIYTLII